MKLLTNNSVKKLMILSLTAITFFGVATSSVAWLKRGNEVSLGNTGNVHINAGAEAAYYGGGDGSKDDPYIISNQNHLYNLAWLQYIGMYNVDDITSDSPNVQISEKYFKVTDTIDMAGIVLPPIGTETYPFFSHFDGNNQTIKNLTISNDDPTQSTSDFGVTKPSFIPNHCVETLTRVEGFFGVVGPISTNKIIDEDDYENIVPDIKNITLQGITVQTGTNTAPDEVLIGLAAGYLDGNMSGVKVSGTSSIKVDGETALDSDNITSNLSNYGLVGYSVKKGVGGDYSQDITQYYNSDLDTEGNDAEWGGSVNMAKVYKRLSELRPARTSSNVFEKTDKYIDGVYDSTSSTNQTYYRFTANTGDDYRGNFNYSNISGKMYMTGGTHLTSSYYVSSEFFGHYITDGTTHYLTSTIGDTNNPNNKRETIWEFIEQTDGTYLIHNYNDETGNHVYLRNDSGQLRGGTLAQATSWTITKNGTNLSIESVYNEKTYRILYLNRAWNLFDVDTVYQTQSHTTISNTTNGEYYIPDDIIGNTTDVINAITTEELTFTRLTNNNSVQLSYNNSTYYLSVYRPNASTDTYYLSAATTSRDTSNNDTNTGYHRLYYYSAGYFRTRNKVRRRTNNQNYDVYLYLVFSDNKWQIVESTSQNSSTNAPVVATIVDNTIYYRDYYFLNNTLDSAEIQAPEVFDHDVDEGMKFTSSDTTYFPLNVYDSAGTIDGVSHRKYDPTSKNTGYVVAAATGIKDYDSGNNSWNYLRSVTMTEYTSSGNSGKIKNSFSIVGDDTSNTLHDILTVKGSGASGIVPIDESDYVKYETSKARLENVLNSQDANGNVHGIHFTNTGHMGKISKDHYVNATNVRIGDNKYDNYQLPVYCIDFNLTRKGIINFFAGSYNGRTTLGEGIDSFFSLHQVIRNSSNEISDIKEIRRIFSTGEETDDYIYSYVGADGEVDASGSEFDDTDLIPLFDTTWLGKNTSLSTKGGYVFYFEIPVNKGEFCLGNVENASEGCYLLYLDIAANGSDQKDIIYSFSVYTNTEAAYYPFGVDFAVVGATNDGGDSICILIDATSDGTITFAVNEAGNNINITDEAELATYSYKSGALDESFTVSGNSPGELQTTPSKVRISYVHVVTVEGKIYDLVITDVFGTNNTFTSTYVLDGSGISLANLQSKIPSLNADMLSTIRNREIVISLERVSGKAAFDAVLPELPWVNSTTNLPWTDEPPYYISIDVSNETIKVTITNPTDGSVIVAYINDKTVTNGKTYTMPSVIEVQP